MGTKSNKATVESSKGPRTGRKPRFERAAVDAIRETHKRGEGYDAIAEAYGVSRNTIVAVVKRTGAYS